MTRNFQEIWELKFVVTQVNEKTVCLLCKKSFSENKADIYGPSRVREIAHLKSQFQDQKSILKQFLSSNELVTLASYKADWILSRKKKPLSDAQMVKDILVTVMETLLENYELKVKNDILQKVQNLQLSRRTVVRRVRELAKNIEEQLLEQLKDCLCFSLALDESTDCTDTVQLIFWVRFVLSNFTIHEEIFELCRLRGHTCETDILEHFISASKHCDLDLIKFASITTDGVTAMIGRKSGFVSRLKQHLSENGVKNMLPYFHCILHQENLCAQMLGTDTLKTLMDKVVKIKNYIRSGSSLIHRQFVEALKECGDCDLEDLTDYANVRWLSRGKVLERFTYLLPQIQDFLVEKRQIEKFSNIENPSWQCDLHFLCDIMAYLNELNVKLQGKGKVICELAQHIQEFKSKLNLIHVQTQKDDLTHFAEPNRFLEKNEECGLLDVKRQLYVNWIKNMSQKFESPISKLLSMFESTWVCESMFSTIGFIKSKHRSRIVDVNLEAELRCALSSDIQPKFMQLVRNKDCQISH
ncbi:hypothetical protein FKM82_001319 [Ascaphus truei]